jgi:hypothetical protein
MKKTLLYAGLLAIGLVAETYFPPDPNVRVAIAPAIVAALISAAAAAAGGIAGAAGQGEAAKAQGQQSAAERRLHEKIVKMQLAQQQQQFDQAHRMQAAQALGSTHQDQASIGLDRAAERQKSRAGLINAFSQMMG